MSDLLANVTCVAVDGRGLLITGAPGSGKSSLALALIDRGAMLVGDDGVTLAVADGRLIASPPPHTAGLIEVRNVGLVRLATASAPLALAVCLTAEAPRLPDGPDTLTLRGLDLPLLALWPESTALPLRALRALAMHGLA